MSRSLGSAAGRYRLPEAWRSVGRRRPRFPRVAEREATGEAGSRDAALARLEAVLWIAREPLGSRRLAHLATLADGTQARTLVRQLNRRYDSHGCAFRAEEVAGGFQLMTRSGFAPWLRRLHTVPVDVRLSAPALETLAVVAYRQPVLRADVEAVRGVQCGEILRQLIERDLVRVLRRSDELGRPLLYGTTKQFLRVFGLKSLDELPQPASFGTPTTPPSAESPERSGTPDQVNSPEQPNLNTVPTEPNSQQGEEPEVKALVQPTSETHPSEDHSLVETQLAQADLPGGFDEDEDEFEDEYDEDFDEEEDEDIDEDIDDDDEEDDEEEDEEEDEDEDDEWDDEDLDELEEEDDEDEEDEEDDKGDLDDEPWEEVKVEDEDVEDADEDEDEEDEDEDWDEDDDEWEEDEDEWEEDDEDEDWDEDDEDEEEWDEEE